MGVNLSLDSSILKLLEARQVTVDYITEESSVLDIACGTGQLCFALRGAETMPV